MTSLKQHLEYLNFLYQIPLDHPVQHLPITGPRVRERSDTISSLQDGLIAEELTDTDSRYLRKLFARDQLYRIGLPRKRILC